MSALDLLGVLDSIVPQGPTAEADSSLTTIGPVYGVDAAERLVQVGVHGTPMWLPANPGRYRARAVASGTQVAAQTLGTGLARVLMNPATGRPAVVLGPVDPREPVIPGTLTAIDTVAKVATVTVDGGSHVLPYLLSTYTVGTSVWVGTDDWGQPTFVYGPSEVTPVSAPPPPPPVAASTIQVTQTIGPQWSGSYRHNRSAWDRWNTSEYGGRSTLYQGNGFGSGPMTGLAVYGAQLVNLAAISIDRVEVMLRGVGLSGASGPATVQGSPNDQQPPGAPSSSGDTATGEGWVALTPSMREAMRTGAVRGLALVGGNYWAVAGHGNGDGMVLSITYTRPA